MASLASINIAGKEFQCDYLSDVTFDDPEAVYIILCVGSGSGWGVIDFGLSNEMSATARLEGWKASCKKGTLWAGKYKMSGAAEHRRQSIAELRSRYKVKT